ncbi:hypothetical protein [Rikenella microfusus]|uniref:Uncharacterized protein n=1 Tax=Rikenella microfusus TaxID=28139 RepID=A0A379MQZ4_9BACT|nr:hypothetical protein [Rikenella microfusus]SUE34134.1 Uncharacterised protein [Rikenella microfusus]
MNKLLICATALYAFASCTKQEPVPTPPTAEGSRVTVSFTSAPATRAFFGADASAEV